MTDISSDATCVATIRLFRERDGRYVAIGVPEDRDAAEVLGRGDSAEAALRALGCDYDEAPPVNHRTVRIE